MKLTELATEGEYSIYIKDKNSENVVNVLSKHYKARHDGEGPTWLINSIWVTDDYDHMKSYIGLYDGGASVLIAQKRGSFVLITGMYTKRAYRRKNHAKNLVSLFIRTIFEQTKYMEIHLRFLDDKNSLKNLYIKSAHLAKCDVNIVSIKRYEEEFDHHFKYPFDLDESCQKLHSDIEIHNAVGEIRYIKN